MSINICLVCSLLYIYPFTCLAYPVLQREANDIQQTGTTLWSNSCLGIVVGLLSTVCLILTVGICVCCGKNKYFKWPRRHPRRVLRSNFGNGVSGCHEISIFPPPGIDQYLSASTSNICFEPLPDITSQLDRNHPSRLSSSVASNLNEDWFAEPHKNFPRNQLQYLRKLGSGWFGQVLEGRAIGVDTDHTSTVITTGQTSKSTPVVVKSLREDASQKEQAFFLQELMPYRDLEHKNVLKIVAYCLETQPLLVLLQCCSKGDLKSFLKKDSSLNEVTLLKMAEDAAQGLAHMHEHNFIHTDLAARNCLVEEDLTVKIGDYGFSLEIYQDDYYLAENVALPLRWCAPETLHCTDTTIEARELTTAANVWSFGVVLWEIFSRGRLPYEELDEDGIIQKVILERSQVLQNPQKSCETKLDDIFSSCFEAVEKRPAMPYLCSLLSNLSKCLEEKTEEEFEGRWNQLSPEQVQNQHNVMAANNALEMKFESDFSPIDEKKSSPTASLKNFHGSADDLDARIAAKFGSAIPSWLGLEPGQTMDSFTEEISDAIQRLDDALSEDRSESNTSVSSPEKGSLNFRLGKNSLVLNPPLAARTLSDGEEENLTMRLEQGDFSELVRLKSQSVQDFMRLTVVDDGSDSSDKASQPGSFVGDYPSVHHPTQDKNFSSESNLKEAVRDAGFMVELEKLQAEHKFSIISEASREGMSSIEDANRHGMSSIEDSSQQEMSYFDESNHLSPVKDACKLVMSSIKNSQNANPYSEIFPKDSNAEDSMENNNSFLGNDFPSSKMEGRKSISPKDEFKVDNIFDARQKGEISPDCVVSSRGVLSAPLPDIISHDGNVKMSISSDSLLDEDKTDVSNVHNSTLSIIEGDINAQDNDSVKTSGVYSFDKEGSKDDITDPACIEAFLSSDIDMKHTPVNNTNANYRADNVVIGQDIIIGALEDYSLEFYKPVKSVDNLSSYQNSLSSDNCMGDLNHNANESRDDDTSDLDHSPLQPRIRSINDNEKITEKDTSTEISSTGNYTKEEVSDSTNSENSFENDAVLVDANNAQGSRDADSPNYPNDINSSFNSNINDSSSSSDSFFHVKYDMKDESELNRNLNLGNTKVLHPSVNEEVNKEYLSDTCESKENSSTDSDNLNNGISSQESVKKSCAESQDGEFWESQMAAWQEAAEQTRELLYEAAHPPDSEDDLLDMSKSPESSHKSPFSSTDRLDDSDDEGTYVSFDAGDDDVVRFNPDDIAALRSELSLKLRDISDQPPPYNEAENEKDMIFINYKNSNPSTLSPIKEEAGMDFEMYSSSESSYDFADINQIEEKEQMDKPPVSPESLRISLPCHDNDGETPYDVSKEEARDSLILEDLEYDGSPQQAMVIGPLAPRGSSEDLLMVDTVTNKVTLVDSGRPQSHIAFLVEGEQLNEDAKFLQDENTANEKFEDDDVDYESLPYEDQPSQVPSFQISKEAYGNDSSLSLFQISKETCVDDLPVIRNVEEDEAPHYQSYFTSAVSSIHPTPSLDGNDAFESAEHISLPYDVNLPVMKIPDEKVKPGQTFEEISKSEIKRKFSSDSEKEAVILDDPSVENSFVTLSFLGRLYSDDTEENKDEEEGESLGRFNSGVEDSQNSSMEHFYSTKSDDDSSDNDDIEELLPEPSTPQHDEEPTPKRTPSHLPDFVWRGDPPDERYTPDWESDSDGNEDMESSSTSGEFIWQPGDSRSNSAMCIPSVDKTSLEWQMANEKVEEPPTPVPAEEEDYDDDDDGSESGEEEFTPSTWNCELTPQRSLLKSPESTGGKKSVHWKRQRHHRVYEYPPEPQSWHAEATNPTPRRSWGSSHSLDYLTLADWELGGDEFLHDNCEDFEEFFPKGRRQISAPQIYSLAPFAYDKPPEDLFSNSCEYFMGSPGSSYAFSRSSFTPADFFPSQNPNTYNYLEESNVKSGDDPPESYDVPDSKHVPEESKLSREKLRLDLPTLCLAESQTPGSERQNFSL